MSLMFATIIRTITHCTDYRYFPYLVAATFYSPGVALTGGGLGYATGAGFALGAAGGAAGLYGGFMQTYASNPNAGIGAYALGGGMGLIGGGLVPGMGIGSFVGTAGGGTLFGSQGAQWGGLIGGFVGGGVQQIATNGWAKSWQALAWQAGGATAFGGTAYAITGNGQSALFWANMGQMTGGIVHAGIGLYNKWSALYDASSSALTRFRRLFWDPREFDEISEAYWAPRGGAGDSSLHHWLFSQADTWVPQGLRNAGFNLIELGGFRGVFHPSLTLNTWMGFAPRWMNSQSVDAMLVEGAIRVGIPLLGAAAGTGGYYVGSAATQRLSGVQRHK